MGDGRGGTVIAAAGRGTGRLVYSDVKAEMLINVHCSCHIHGINKYQIKSGGRDSFTNQEMKVPLSRGVAQTAYRRDCKHQTRRGVSQGRVPTCRGHLARLFQAFLQLTQFNCGGTDKTARPCQLL